MSIHKPRPPSSLQTQRRRVSTTNNKNNLDSQSIAREQALQRYSSLQQLHNTTKNTRQFIDHNNNTYSKTNTFSSTTSLNNNHTDTKNNISTLANSLKNLHLPQNPENNTNSSDFEQNFEETTPNSKKLTIQEEYIMKNNNSNSQNNPESNNNRQILQNYNRMNQEAGSSSIFQQRSGRSSIASSSTITSVRTPMSGRTGTGMVRTGSSLSSSNISNTNRMNHEQNNNTNSNNFQIPYPTSPIHQNPPPKIAPRSQSLAARENTSNNLSLSSQNQHRKTSAGSAGGFVTPNIPTTGTTPLPKGDNRRKTAKEIAQMYEQLKNKYIERKREWQVERNELLKKLGLANESQQLLGNMKTIAEIDDDEIA